MSRYLTTAVGSSNSRSWFNTIPGMPTIILGPWSKMHGQERFSCLPFNPTTPRPPTVWSAVTAAGRGPGGEGEAGPPLPQPCSPIRPWSLRQRTLSMRDAVATSKLFLSLRGKELSAARFHRVCGNGKNWHRWMRKRGHGGRPLYTRWAESDCRRARTVLFS